MLDFDRVPLSKLSSNFQKPDGTARAKDRTEESQGVKEWQDLGPGHATGLQSA